MLYDKNWETKHKKPELQEWQKVLLNAADIIMEKGWCRDSLENSYGHFCLIGAIAVAEGIRISNGAGTFQPAYDMTRPTTSKVFEYIEKRYPGKGGSIHGFNDSYCRSTAQALSVLRGAAKG